jgi:hypothetical protein
MSTQLQIDANRRNAQLSTGPRTEAGLETSSRNNLQLGLFTRRDYVKPDERPAYNEFRSEYLLHLSPEGPVEETIAAEIVSAAWRLRRCAAAEADLADTELTDDETTEKNLRAIDRARASANNLLHRSLNQLRKLQTERLLRLELNLDEPFNLADYKQIAQTVKRQTQTRQQNQQSEAEAYVQDQLDEAMNCGIPSLEYFQEQVRQYNAKQAAESASNCTAAETVPAALPEAA